MRKLKQKAVFTLTTVAALTGSMAAVGGPANAASSPIAACGGGSYHVIDSEPLSNEATEPLSVSGRDAV